MKNNAGIHSPSTKIIRAVGDQILPSIQRESEQSGTGGSSVETEQGLGETGREADRPQTYYRPVMFLYPEAQIKPSTANSISATHRPVNLKAQSYSRAQGCSNYLQGHGILDGFLKCFCDR